MNYVESLAWLDTHINMETGMVHDASRAPDVSAGRSFSPPSLDRMRRLCAFLGDPQLDLSILHITGTNGKGSTARMAASLLHAHGLTTGLYTSPHLHRPNERIASGDGDISDAELAELVSTLARAESAAGQRNSWFELMTAGAFRWFSDIAAEAAVIEVGAGGRSPPRQHPRETDPGCEGLIKPGNRQPGLSGMMLPEQLRLVPQRQDQQTGFALVVADPSLRRMIASTRVWPGASR